jgi:hypothetical protein
MMRGGSLSGGSIAGKERDAMNDLPDWFAARVNHWLRVNEQDRANLQHGYFPLGMVQRWIERAEEAEAKLKRLADVMNGD